MKNSAISIDLHTHTVASGHAFATLAELVEAAKTKGIEILAITDHGPSMEGAPTPGYFEMFRRIPSRWDNLRLLFGCEANIIDTEGHIDLDSKLTNQLPIILAGLHQRTPYPQNSTRRENTLAIVNTIRYQTPNIISHPYRSSFPIDVDSVVDAACDHQTLLEVNLSLFKTILATTNSPGQDETVIATRQLINQMRRKGGYFVINSDAHLASELGCETEILDELARLLDFELDEVLNRNLELIVELIPFLKAT